MVSRRDMLLALAATGVSAWRRRLPAVPGSDPQTGERPPKLPRARARLRLPRPRPRRSKAVPVLAGQTVHAAARYGDAVA